MAWGGTKDVQPQLENMPLMDNEEPFFFFGGAAIFSCSYFSGWSQTRVYMGSTHWEGLERRLGV